MAKCDHCHQRKGKRACPYLDGHICSVCCGENRGVSFDCPRECPYFGPPIRREEATGAEAEASPASPAATARTAGSPAASGTASAAPAEPAPDLSRYQRYLSAERRTMADLMARIELAIASYDRGRSNVVDTDAVAALEFMRRRASPISTLEQFAPQMGVFLEKTLLESYRGGPAPGPYDLMEVLDHLIEIARNFGPAGSRRYLEEVALFEKHSHSSSGGKASPHDSPRIIIPR